MAGAALWRPEVQISWQAQRVVHAQGQAQNFVAGSSLPAQVRSQCQRSRVSASARQQKGAFRKSHGMGWSFADSVLRYTLTVRRSLF